MINPVRVGIPSRGGMQSRVGMQSRGGRQGRGVRQGRRRPVAQPVAQPTHTLTNSARKKSIRNLSDSAYERYNAFSHDLVVGGVTYATEEGSLGTLTKKETTRGTKKVWEVTIGDNKRVCGESVKTGIDYQHKIIGIKNMR